jgi:predicted metal-binding membrane protein
MTVLLITGVMQLATMAALAGVIAGERLGPWPNYFAKTVGLGIIALGAVTVARAMMG